MGASRAPKLRLGLVADPQFADIESSKTRFYRKSIGKLAEAVEHFNGLDLDGCVNLGDLIDRHWESFDEVLKPLSRSRHKFRHLLGNHDFELPDEFKARVPRRLGLKNRYYSVRAGAFCLVMLDTTDISPYSHPKDSKESIAATAAGLFGPTYSSIVQAGSSALNAVVAALVGVVAALPPAASARMRARLRASAPSSPVVIGTTAGGVTVLGYRVS